MLGKAGEKTFCCKICNSKQLQLGSMGLKVLKTKQEGIDSSENLDSCKKSSLAKSFSVSHSPNQSTISVPSTQVKKSEIVVALKSFTSRRPQNSFDEFAQLVTLMFPDVSSIASGQKLGRTKLHYLIQFRLAKYYKEKIFSSLLPKIVIPPKFVSCFDEVFNMISKRKQMEVRVTNFDNLKEQFVCSCIDSHFMGHAKVE